jgi:hypothetical protein
MGQSKTRKAITPPVSNELAAEIARVNRAFDKESAAAYNADDIEHIAFGGGDHIETYRRTALAPLYNHIG